MYLDIVYLWSFDDFVLITVKSDIVKFLENVKRVRISILLQYPNIIQYRARAQDGPQEMERN